MRLLRMLTGMRTFKGACTSGGMLLVMMALAGLLRQQSQKGRDRQMKS